ncbi:hypothetical protein J6590_006790 [Homalodisca vitripennis]|nr:hypothetical protein J6590_006790 [Homalodisca vitripennis]
MYKVEMSSYNGFFSYIDFPRPFPLYLLHLNVFSNHEGIIVNIRLKENLFGRVLDGEGSRMVGEGDVSQWEAGQSCKVRNNQYEPDHCSKLSAPRGSNTDCTLLIGIVVGIPINITKILNQKQHIAVNVRCYDHEAGQIRDFGEVYECLMPNIEIARPFFSKDR